MNWEIFRDQILTFEGVAFIIGAIFIPVIIYLLQRRKKGLSYQILPRTPLLTSKEKTEGKIKVLYDDDEVQNVEFIEIKVLNTGNICISAEDYERPLKFIFGSNVKILSAEIIESDPESLTPDIKVAKNEIEVTPVLMNSKDYFVVKAIVSNASNESINVVCRIKDVKNIKNQEKNYKEGLKERIKKGFDKFFTAMDYLTYPMIIIFFVLGILTFFNSDKLFLAIALLGQATLLLGCSIIDWVYKK